MLTHQLWLRTADVTRSCGREGLTGGSGPTYENGIQAVRKALPFRKWRTGSGNFTGTDMLQKEDFTIVVGQKDCAEALNPIKVSKGAMDSHRATDAQVSQGRGCQRAPHPGLSAMTADCAPGK